MKQLRSALIGAAIGLIALPSFASGITGGQAPLPSLSSYQTAGRVNAKVAALASNTVYAAGTVTYSSGTYTAANGPQPCPLTLAAGQVYFVNFNAANPGAASLIVCGLPTKTIKVLNSAGAALTLAGGEIIAGPATVFYDGVEFIYSTPGPRSIAVTGAKTLTQANFTAHDTLFLSTGAETMTLPCSSTLSPNGWVELFTASGALTVQTGSGCSPTDAITENGGSVTTITFAMNAPVLWVATDGAGHFYLSATGSPCSGFGTSTGTCAQGNDSRITGALQGANNLSDVATPATALSNLGGLSSSSSLNASNLLSGTVPPARITAATTLAIGGATLGANALAVTGSAAISGALALGGNIVIPDNGLISGGTGIAVLRFSQFATANGLVQIGASPFGSGQTILGVGAFSTANNSSGIATALGIIPTINQSGTAGFNALLVNVVETATGSGCHCLGRFQVAGTDEFKIDDAGNTTATGADIAAAFQGSGSVAVSALGTCSAMVNAYSRKVANDLLAWTAPNTTAAGGGSVVGPVFCNMVNWVTE